MNLKKIAFILTHVINIRTHLSHHCLASVCKLIRIDDMEQIDLRYQRALVVVLFWI